MRGGPTKVHLAQETDGHPLHVEEKNPSSKPACFILLEQVLNPNK